MIIGNRRTDHWQLPDLFERLEVIRWRHEAKFRPFKIRLQSVYQSVIC